MHLPLPTPALLSLIAVWALPDGALATLERAGTLEEVQARLWAGQLAVPGWSQQRHPDRAPALRLARQLGLPAAAVVLDLPPPTGAAPAHPPEQLRQAHELRRSLGGPAAPALEREGYSTVHVIRHWADLPGLTLEWQPLPPDRRELTGPFDLIGDVHGCLEELTTLLDALGYAPDGTPPAGRTAVFLGDLGDRGPDTPGVLRRVMGMVAAGQALCVAGNHDDKLARALHGHRVSVTHGLEVSLAQLERETPEFRAQAADFLGELPAHLVLDGGRLVAAHAGLPGRWHGRIGDTARAHALYGDVRGRDELGLPIRADWASSYQGEALVVYGHTPVAAPRWVGNTVNLDTGCVFGGQLTALRYPERQTVSVPARQVYRAPPRPLRAAD